MTKSLRLRAESAEDLEIISAALHVAETLVEDIAHLAGKRRFVIMLNRYRWETDDPDNERMPDKIRCGMHFEQVLSVQAQNIDPADEERVLDLIRIECEEHADRPCEITLNFAGDAAILLTVDYIDVYMKDIGEPWSAEQLPAAMQGHTRQS